MRVSGLGPTVPGMAANHDDAGFDVPSEESIDGLLLSRFVGAAFDAWSKYGMCVK